MKVSRKILLFILILSGSIAPRCGAAVYHSDGSAANVQALVHAARDGDTITLPAGRFNWTQYLSITKGITLQGQTTVEGAGTANPVINDATTVVDNVPRGSNFYVMDVSLTPSQSFRMTGITFAAGDAHPVPSTASGAIRIHSIGASANNSVRIDHCHFKPWYVFRALYFRGWTYGVIDHIIVDHTAGIGGDGAQILVEHQNWGGSNQDYGNGSWADFPYYGTEKFVFIEDSTFNYVGSNYVRGLIDGEQGCRYVVRHNYCLNCVVGNHGTEGGVGRGARAHEVYGNTFNLVIGAGQSEFRSGTALFHDNVVMGHASNNNTICTLTNFRETYLRPAPIWGLADGTSVWDANDTDGNGHFVEGQPPFLFDSGTATRSEQEGSVTDSSKTWTTDQWKGFSIHKPNTSSAYGAYITGNSAHTIHYYTGTPDAHLILSTGDTYEIHRVLVQMDQNGRGKTDQIVGSTPVLQSTGHPGYPHPTLEPCYSWNNVYQPTGGSIGFDSRDAQPTSKENVDFFNLGIGFPENTTPSAVSSTYTVALNGVDYVGSFIYPHPLVVGVPRAVLTDFNNDGSPDFVLRRAGTDETAIWYLNNNGLIGGDAGPTLSPDWRLVASADFDLDGHADYALFHPDTGYTAIWYMSGATLVGGAWGPTLPNGWELMGAADFNGDSHPDYVLYNASTQQTAIWYLLNHLLIGGDAGPILPNGWRLIGVADFDRDGHSDYLLFHPRTGDTAIWYLSGPTLIGGEFGPTIPGGWYLVATADFDSDGNPDFLLYNPDTHDTAIWYLNNNLFVSSASGPTLPAAWGWIDP